MIGGGAADQPTLNERAAASNRRPRSVLVIITEWPSGTMAFKLGSAMKSALRVADEEMKVVQMKPERIFRAVTNVSEAEFRAVVAERDISCPGRLVFIEL